MFLKKKICLLVQQVDTSSCWTTRPCLLVMASCCESMLPGRTRRHVLLLAWKTCRPGERVFVEQEDMSACWKIRHVLSSTRSHVFVVKKKTRLLVRVGHLICATFVWGDRWAGAWRPDHHPTLWGDLPVHHPTLNESGHTHRVGMLCTDEAF